MILKIKTEYELFRKRDAMKRINGFTMLSIERDRGRELALLSPGIGEQIRFIYGLIIVF